MVRSLKDRSRFHSPYIRFPRELLLSIPVLENISVESNVDDPLQPLANEYPSAFQDELPWWNTTCINNI